MSSNFEINFFLCNFDKFCKLSTLSLYKRILDCQSWLIIIYKRIGVVKLLIGCLILSIIVMNSYIYICCYSLG